jgi:hypothetical protein
MSTIVTLLKSNRSLYSIAKMTRDIRKFALIDGSIVPKLAAIWKVYTHTMLPPARLINICECVDEVRDLGIVGDMVECGVWSGGSMALMALWDMRSDTGRRYHAFDSFEGLPPPTTRDNEVFDRFIANRGNKAVGISDRLERTGICKGDGADTVRAFFLRAGIPSERSVFHVGWFQDTVPVAAKQIDSIAVLRLDGDWYESTKVCLDNLYDLVPSCGVIIIDDYGTFSGCQTAVDEFRAKRGITSPIISVDGDCVFFRKP